MHRCLRIGFFTATMLAFLLGPSGAWAGSSTEDGTSRPRLALKIQPKPRKAKAPTQSEILDRIRCEGEDAATCFKEPEFEDDAEPADLEAILAEILDGLEPHDVELARALKRQILKRYPNGRSKRVGGRGGGDAERTQRDDNEQHYPKTGQAHGNPPSPESLLPNSFYYLILTYSVVLVKSYRLRNAHARSAGSEAPAGEGGGALVSDATAPDSNAAHNPEPRRFPGARRAGIVRQGLPPCSLSLSILYL